MGRKARRRDPVREAALAFGILFACLAVGWRLLDLRSAPPAGRRLLVVPVGQPDEAMLRFLTSQLGREHRVKRLPAIDPPRSAWSDVRGQYDAERFLQSLTTIPLAHGDRLLAVADQPAGTSELTIVFGLAEQSGQRAVIFTRRLTDGAEQRTWQHRVLTTARHEIGHLAGLRHCASATCAMHFSRSIGDTDLKGPGFCESCQRAWEAARG